MLLQINDFDLDSIGADDEVLAAINLLGEAAFNGRHIVLGSRPLLRKLAASFELSRMARQYFGWMSEALTQYGNLVSSVPYVVIDNSSVSINKLGSQWIVPLKKFSRAEFLFTTELICESNHDFNVLTKLAEIYIDSEYKGVNLRVRSKPGGGNMTADVLGLALEEPNPVSICVIDSDKELVDGRLGETAKRCLRVCKDKEDWRVQLYVLDARELENLIPHDVVVSVLADEGKDVTLASSLSTIHRDIGRFGCLKSGERPCRFHDIGSDHQGYFATKFALQRTSQNCAAFNGCGSSCGEHGCQIFPRLGEDFLFRLSEWLRHPSNRRRMSKIVNWPSELISALKLIVVMGVALPRKFA
jgi:hypothetical protein